MNVFIEQINSVGKIFIEFALPMLIQSSILIIILLAIDFVLRKRIRAVFRYWIWMIVLVKLILPPTLSLPTTPAYWFGHEINKQELQEPKAPIQEESPVYPISSYMLNDDILPLNNTVTSDFRFEPTTYIEEDIVVSNINPRVPLSWQGLSLLIWLAITFIMILLLIQRTFFVKRLIKQSQKSNEKLNNILEQARLQMGLKNKVEIRLSEIALSPSVCGLFRPVILIPNTLTKTINTNDLHAVFLHELAHIKRYDLWVNLVQAILQIIYIYNPLLWIANIAIRNVREQAVDEMVLVAMGERAEQYPKTLLNISRLSFGSAALSLRLVGVAESKKALFSRIKHITCKPFPKTVKIGITGLITLIIASFVLLPMAKGQRETGSNNIETDNASEEIIDKLANDVINENSSPEPDNLSETELPESEVEWRAQHSGIRDYVKLQEAGGFYQQGIEMFDVNDLPILYELLKDDEYAPYWHNIAGLIGFLSDKPKIEESVTNLLDYFQRDDGNKDYSLSGKIRSISMIGLIGSDLADSILRKAVTIEGARELAKNWIDNKESWPDEIFRQHPELATSGIQGAALSGLVYSETRENLDYLEKLYLEEKNASSPSQDFEYRENLVTAMVKKDYMEEHGIGASIGLFSGPGIFLDPLIPYYEKYDFPAPEKVSEEDEWKAKYSDVREFVKLGKITLHYDKCREMFDKDDLPLLYELLKDKEYAPYWVNVAWTIGFISDDPDSIPVLLDYFQRVDEFQDDIKFLGKISSLGSIGLIGGETADAILKKAITKEGALELAQNWIKNKELLPKAEHFTEDYIILYIRETAMYGLVYSRKPENIKMVQDIYTKEKEKIINEQKGSISGGLVDIMAANDYLTDNNDDFGVFFRETNSLNKRVPYITKYIYEYSEEDSAETGWSETVNGLRWRISLPSDKIVIGKPITVDMEFQNVSDKPLRIFKEPTVTDNLYPILYTSDGNRDMYPIAHEDKYNVDLDKTVLIESGDIYKASWSKMTYKQIGPAKITISYFSPQNTNPEITQFWSGNLKVQECQFTFVPEDGTVPEVKPEAVQISPPDNSDLPELWKELGVNDQERAYEAVEKLCTISDNAVQLINQQIKLENIGPGPFPTTTAEWQIARSIRILELIGSEAAKKLLTKIAEETKGEWPSLFADAAITRLANQPKGPTVEKFGSNRGIPIYDGFLFFDGKYMPAPYIVERWGVDVYINGVLVTRGHDDILGTDVIDNQKASQENRLKSGSVIFDRTKGGEMGTGKQRGIDLIVSLLSGSANTDTGRLNREAMFTAGFQSHPQLIQRLKLSGVSLPDNLADTPVIKEPADINEEDSAQANRETRYNEIGGFIKAHGLQNQVRYNEVRELITKDDLPILYELLDDDEYAPYWHKVVAVIGYISDDPESVNVLLKFLQRNDISKVNGQSLMGKAFTLVMAGLIGGDKADSVLRTGVTKEGALELTKDWIDELLPRPELIMTKERMIFQIQQHSILGLVYSRKPENLALVEEMYNEHKEISIKNNEQTELMSALINSMANNDLIAEVGLDVCLGYHRDEKLSALSPYFKKYRFDLNEDSAEIGWSEPQNGLSARVLSTQPYWIPGQSPQVRFQVRNVSNKDIIIRPLDYDNSLVNLSIGIQLPNKPETRRSLEVIRHTNWKPPEPITLKPGESIETSTRVSPSPNESNGALAWEVIAELKSPSFNIDNNNQLWKGTITVSTLVKFHDITKLPAEQLVSFLNTDCSVYSQVRSELVRRWKLEPPIEAEPIQYSQAIRSANSKYVVFFRAYPFDGMGFPTMKGDHLVLARSDGKVMWSKSFDFADFPSVGNDGTVAAAEWLETPPHFKVRIISANGDDVGSYETKPSEAFLERWNNSSKWIRPLFSSITAIGISPNAKRIYFATTSEWEGRRLRAINRNGELQWEEILNEVSPFWPGSTLRISPDERYVLVADTNKYPSNGFVVFSDKGKLIYTSTELDRNAAFSFDSDILTIKDQKGTRKVILSEYENETIENIIKEPTESYDTKPIDSANVNREEKYNEVTEFIKRNGPQAQVRYSETLQVITKDKIPILYELLDNDEYAPYWNKVVAAIGQASDNPESVNVLLKFIKRNDNKKLDRTSFLSKASAFGSIGNIGGDMAESILRKAVTKEGIKELTKDWIDEPLPEPFDAEIITSMIQQSSLTRLVLIGKPEYLSLVEKMYNEERENSIKNHEITRLMFALIDVMVEKDAIAEVGLETLKNMSEQQKSDVKNPYSWKYLSDLGLKLPDPNEILLNKEKSTKANHDAKYNEIGGFIGQQNQVRYNEVREAITKDDLPILYELLDDDEYAPYWHKVVAAIGYASDDPESVDVLFKFLQRNDISKLNMSSLMGKPFTLNMMGLIGGDKADSILRKGATPEGALELAKEWIDEKPLPIPSDTTEKQAMINMIQQHAYLGLIYSQKPENIAFVENLYNEQKKISISNHKNTELMSGLINTMATKDLIAEKGLEAFLNITNDSSQRIGAKAPYIRKYSFSLDEEASDFIDNEIITRLIEDASLKSDIREYIKSGGQWSQVRYKEVRKQITKEKLPILYELFDDDEFAPYWHKVVAAIGYTSASNDPESINVLLKYVQRNDNSKVDMHSIMGKSFAFAMIGLIGGDKADAILRKSVTIEGAKDLTKNWINERPLPGIVDNERMIGFIQQHSLDGLVFSGKKENLALVEKIYNEQKLLSIKNHKRTELMSALISAMAQKDYIADIGLEAYLNKFDSDVDTGEMSPYFNKYRFSVDEEDSTLDEFMTKYNEMISFGGQTGQVQYSKIRELVTKDKLPVLYKLLDNDEYAPYWHKVVSSIGYASNDPETANVLLDFIQRNDNHRLDRFSTMSKAIAFMMMGFIGGDTADAVLKKGVSRKDLQELTKAWINDLQLETFDTERMINSIQQHALLGLVFSGKPENLALLERIYNEEKQISIDNNLSSELRGPLSDAMAARDYIAENGLESYMSLNSPSKKISELHTYLLKYMYSFN